MNLSINGTLGSFLLAILVWFLFDIIINYAITDPRANRAFHIVLLVIVIIIALGGSFFLKVQ